MGLRVLFTLLLLTITAQATSQQLGDEAYGILKSALMYDASYPLNARSAGSFEESGVTVENIVFDSFHHGSVPGILSLPTKGEGPFPVVMLMHGLTSEKSAWLEDGFNHGSLVLKGLNEKGYAVMALDAQYHGDRAIYNDFINPGEMVFKKNWFIRYSNMMTQTIVDYRRAIDYLASRNDIDINRVGILGYSMGGHMTFLLAASEPRVKTIVGCVVPETPGLPISASAFIRDLNNKPLLMMMATKDQYYSVDSAQNLFDSIPGDSKTLRFFESGHSLPPEYAREATDWIAKHL